MNIRTAATLALVAIAPVTAAACSSNDTASTTTASSTTTTAKATNFEVSTPDGQVSLSLDGKLPPGWPSDFPLPKSAKPAGSGSAGGTSSTRLVGVFSTTGSGQEALDFYTTNPSLKTSGRSVVGAGSSFLGSADLDSPYTGSVTVVARDAKTYLVVDLKTTGGTSGSTTTTGAGSSTTSSTTTG